MGELVREGSRGLEEGALHQAAQQGSEEGEQHRLGGIQACARGRVIRWRGGAGGGDGCGLCWLRT